MTLVKRLRGCDPPNETWIGPITAMMRQAADRIEQLEKALTEIIGLEPTARISTARYLARRALERKE